MYFLHPIMEDFFNSFALNAMIRLNPDFVDHFLPKCGACHGMCYFEINSL